MIRTFIETPIFTKKWYELGLSDEDLQRLQNSLLSNPKLGCVIPGTNGLRKVRITCKNSGKRGGARVLYVDVEVKDTIHLINVYAKNEKDDLTIAERNAIASVLSLLKEE